MISWLQLLQRDFSMPESTITLRLDVKTRSLQEGEWFVKCGRFVNNLRIPRGRCNGIKFPSNIVTNIKRIPLWTFSIEIFSNYWNYWIETTNVIAKNVKRITKGLERFTIFARGPNKCVSKYRSFFMVIFVTKYSFRWAISSLWIMGNCWL